MAPKLLTKSRPTSSHSPIHGLPPSLQVPPGPPQAVHRSLLVSCSSEGLIVRASNSAGGPGRKAGKGALKVAWGVKGKVEEVKGEEGSVVEEEEEGGKESEEGGAKAGGEGEEEEGVEVEIRGILGILRLWNSAYLLVIVDPKSIGAFPTPNHETYSLTNVQAIPLTHHHLAEKALLTLRRSAKAPPPSTQPSTEPAPEGSDLDDAARSASGVRWGEVVTPGNETGAESSSGEEDEDEDEEENEAKRADGSYTSLNKSSTPEKKNKKKINLNPFFKWNPFIPKPITTTAVSSNPLHPTPATATDPLALPDVLPTPSSPTPSDPPIPLVPSSLTLPVTLPTSSTSTSTPTPSSTANATRSHLETKILTSLITLFTSGQMFFSYNHDITNSLAAKHQRGGVDRIPLWRRVDRRFWWNEWLGRELIDAGLHPFILPVMQGWVQISTLHVPRALPPTPASTLSAPEPAAPSNSSATGLIDPPTEGNVPEPEPPAVEYEPVPVEFIVVSRRSRDRAGLRYQRRGLDDEGNVANFVESEMIVRAESHIFSHVQTRGSIPLFWSQSPYSTTSAAYALKPAPVLDRPLAIARGPMAVHFDFLKEKYGDQTVVNLSEATGKEALVTKGFEEVLLGLGRKDVDYQEFDFHHECKGMKFENVSILIDRLNDTFLKQSYFEAGGPDSQKLQSQNGAFRTNCIDCLDRTNVVQSALARHVLGIQLASIGLSQTADSPPSDIETVFNDVWANNGDAISRCYAGTSALKGDFTRTGKRNLQGMINDGLNSISRMYTSAFSDFFSQAVISFMLGQRSLAVFTEFVEKLQVAEPANLLRLAVVRSEAIETCSARVISEGETRQAGWTLFAPTEMNVKGGQQFEEKVLLLTAKALYVARYDYELEKVVGFTRIPLGNVVSLQKGVYILSPLQEAGQDPEENYGFKVSFRGSDDETRLASYSMRNQIEPTSPTKPRPKSSSLRPLLLSSPKPPQPPSSIQTNSPPHSSESEEIKFFAFKAIPRDIVLHGRELSVDRDDEEQDPRGGAQGDEKTCHEVVNGIVGRIRGLCSDAGSGWDGADGEGDGGKFLREEPIISLAEAQSNTPFLARIEHGVKRWLWL